jgi:hypothetical protein
MSQSSFSSPVTILPHQSYPSALFWVRSSKGNGTGFSLQSAESMTHHFDDSRAGQVPVNGDAYLRQQPVPAIKGILPANVPPDRGPTSKIRRIGGSALVLVSGLMAYKFPVKPSRFIVPTDPKVWVKIGLGALGLSQLMSSFSFKKAPWLQSGKDPDKPANWLKAMANVVLMSPLMSGTTGLKIIPVVAPLIGLMVATNDWISDRLEPTFKKRTGLPPVILHLGLSVVGALATYKLLPGTLKRVLSHFKNPHDPKTKYLGATVLTSCARGCCPSAVCLSEMTEMATLTLSAASASMTSALPAIPYSNLLQPNLKTREV